MRCRRRRHGRGRLPSELVPRAPPRVPCRPGAEGRSSREVSQVIERRSRVGLDLTQHLLGLGRVAIDELLGESLSDLQRDQLLLCAVVDVPLELAPLVVLRGDQPLLCSLQLGQSGLEGGREALVAEHETGLGGEVSHELLLGGVDRIAGRHHDRERPQELPLVSHLGREIVIASVGRLLFGPRSGLAKIVPHRQPHPCAFGADPLAQDASGPDQHVVGRVRLRELIAERRHDLVRGRALAVHDPVSESSRSGAYRLEDQGHDGRREGGEDGVARRNPRTRRRPPPVPRRPGRSPRS